MDVVKTALVLEKKVIMVMESRAINLVLGAMVLELVSGAKVLVKNNFVPNPPDLSFAGGFFI